MKVAILEYVCGSGLVRAPNSGAERQGWESLLGEGHAMLAALASDLIAAGIAVHCPLEASIAGWGCWKSWTDPLWSWSPVPYRIAPSIDEVARHWIRAARACDAAIVIAPELDGVLEGLIAAMRGSGVRVLAPDAPFLEAACDQWNTCRAWQRAGVRHPKTFLLDDFVEPTDLEYPAGWVIKRRDSAGCVGQRRCQDARQVACAAQHCDASGVPVKGWVVQPWIPGMAASLAVLADRDLCVLGALEQRLEPSVGSAEPAWGYAGGSGPIAGVGMAALEDFALRVLSALPGKPWGWIGIDFVIEPDGQWSAIEINPRLTTSYLGYRAWYGHRLAEGWALGRRPVWERKEFSRVSFSVENFEG